MKLKISSDFSKAPGPRYEIEGKHSGEEFRKLVLFPSVCRAKENRLLLTIDLDGTFGFGTSFLEEAFGGLIRENGLELNELQGILRFISDEEPDLIDEIQAYMRQANEERQHEG